MSQKSRTDIDAQDRIVAMARRHRDERDKGYRAQAFKLYPKICARCGREFSGERLRELTVHHKDHNHDNNPSDGSNWELLCLYCHDNEHSRYQDADTGSLVKPGETQETQSTHRPFADLAAILKPKA
jgi:5-methylcytosine-specific restriction endonuclease McrA